MSTKIIPINVAEAIIEPFFDRQLNRIRDWEINTDKFNENKSAQKDNKWWENQPDSIYVYNDGYSVNTDTEHGLSIFQTWINLEYLWNKKPQDGPAISISRFFDIDCSEYTHLVISMVAPDNSIFTFKAETDIGEISVSYEPFKGIKKEFEMDLKEAKWIGKITLEVEAVNEGEGSGSFQWIGLKNKELLKKYLKQWECFDESWEPYLKPLSYEPSFEPQYGILLKKSELESLRLRYKAVINENEEVQLFESARKARNVIPEKMIHEFVNAWENFQLSRERDYEKNLITRPINYNDFSMGVNTAITGVLLKDKELLRLAARFALSIAISPDWSEAILNRMPGSNWEGKPFIQSLCTFDVAVILDLAWDYFTVVGRQYLMRRIAEAGISDINWMIWKHAEKPEEIFKMNQLIWFTPARILGYALLEKEWKHVYPYTDLAYKDLLESLDYIFCSDGGFAEGPNYFYFVCMEVMKAIYYYSNARGIENISLPESFKNTSNYIEVVMSTDDEFDIIPLGDSGAQGKSSLTAMAIMAALMPQSAWVNMFWKAYNKSDANKYGFFIQKLYQQIPTILPKLKSYIYLPEVGIMSSVRMLNGEHVKIFINGNKANAGHSHSDKGSFVLEFAGDTFAMDPGVTLYGVELHRLLSSCTRHNMLVPVGCKKAPKPLYPLPHDVKPRGFGDEQSFRAEMDLAPGWEGYYDKWIRKWESPEPNIIIIKDEYKLADGTGVEFYWSTKLDVIIQDNTVTIIGKRGKVVIEVPKDCAIRVDELNYLDDAAQKRIAICRESTEGELEVRVNLIC